MTRRDSIIYRDRAYFVGLTRAFPQPRICLTFHRDEVPSMAIVVPYSQKPLHMCGTSSNERHNLMPNHNVRWEMIQWGLGLGMAEYDFDGALRFAPEGGLSRFKGRLCHTYGPIESIEELDVTFGRSAYERFKSAQHKTHH